MPIILNHTIVPARDKVAAARFFADIFGLDFNEQQSGHFAPVQVNDTLTLLFDRRDFRKTQCGTDATAAPTPAAPPAATTPAATRAATPAAPQAPRSAVFPTAVARNTETSPPEKHDYTPASINTRPTRPPIPTVV